MCLNSKLRLNSTLRLDPERRSDARRRIYRKPRSDRELRLDRQDGVGLASAIFLLLVLGGLTVFLLNMSGLQHSSSALDLQGARAYQAARAGIEWGVYRALQDTSCAPQSSFALAGELSEFTVTVVCVPTPYTEVNPAPKTVYSLRATACNRPVAGDCPGVVGSFYVERQLEALIDQVN